MDDSILEPLEAYKNIYKKQFVDNADDMFESLVKKSGIDVGKNRATTKAMRNETAASATIARKRSGLNALRVFLIILAVVGAIAAAVGIYLLAENMTLEGGLCLGIGLCGGVLSAIVIFAALNPKIKVLEAQKRQHDQKAEALRNEAWEQMRSLNGLFDDNMTKQLIEKTVPLIKIDDNFNMRRYDYLSGKYAFGANDAADRSTIGILTGEILGNPFVEDRQLVGSWGSQTYYGSIVITWTTTYRDSNGHLCTQHHSQTLTASVTKPKPIYQKQTRLIYGNEAAPDLHFTHKPTHAERMSENSLERKVKSGSRKLRRRQRKQLANGKGTFTQMGNEEFDVLFGADDRDNEIQFRLLFTPLAQKNMLSLMKDDEGFGDDFNMRKVGCLNYISSEHSANWDMDTSFEKYYSFDVDICKQRFLQFNAQYFKSLFFDLAPLLSIPLYQQHKPREYIYRENYTRNYTDYEAECAVNALGEDAFKHPMSATPALLKTAIISKDGRSDHIEVTAYSYKSEDRVEFVTMLGGDGHLHSIPVHWLEYLPLENKSTVKIKELGFSQREFYTRLAETELGKTIDGYGKRNAYSHGLLCCLVDASDKTFDTELDRVIK